MAATTAAAEPKRKRKPKTKSVEADVEEIRAITWEPNDAGDGGTELCCIKWLDCPEAENEWVPAKHVHCKEMMAAARAHQAEEKPEWHFEYYLDAPIDGFAIGWHPYTALAQVPLNGYMREFCKDKAL